LEFQKNCNIWTISSFVRATCCFLAISIDPSSNVLRTRAGSRARIEKSNHIEMLNSKAILEDVIRYIKVPSRKAQWTESKYLLSSVHRLDACWTRVYRHILVYAI